MPRNFAFLLLATFMLISLSPNLKAQVQTNNQRKITIDKGNLNTLPVSSKRFALIIGVDLYDDSQINRLEGATNDAKALADVLVRYAGFPNDQVVLLTENQSNDRRPTRGNILRRLSNFRSLVPKDGLFLIFFSGHGIERDGRAYLLPTDAQVNGDQTLLEETAINVEVIKNWVRQTGVSQILFILDACRNNPEAGRGGSDHPLTETYTRGFNFDIRNSEVKAFVTLYATEVGQVAYEYKDKKQGYFSWALVEGLKGAAANEQGEITLAGLLNYLWEVVPKRISLDLGAEKKQRPYVVMEGYKPDDLILVKLDRPSVITKTTPTADDFITKGNFLSTQDRWVEAEVAYRNAIRLDPTKVYLHFNLGEALYIQQKWAEAEAEYRQALQSNQSNGMWHLALGKTLQMQKKWLDSESEFRLAIQLEPNNLVFNNQLGTVLAIQEKWADAEVVFAKAVKLDLASAPLHFNLGYTLAQQRKWAKAEVEIKEALRLDQTNERYQELLNTIKAANPSSSSPVVVSKTDKEAASNYNLKGTNFFKQKQYENAVEAQEKATKLDPNNALYFRNLGESLIHLKRFADAANAYKQAVKLLPNNVEGHVGLGNAYRLSNNFNEGVKEFDYALRLDSNNFSALEGLWFYYDQVLNNNTEALKVAKRLVQVGPKSSRAHHHLGATYSKLGKYQDCIDAFREAIRLQPDFYGFYTWIVGSYLKMGKRDEAIKVADKLLKASPEWAKKLHDQINEFQK